ncbi:GatB/YqeY domain-containing protein [Thiohalorhabdus sp.]|uniref:GatB/YqeY domain-containing protein n=1 Tax=Thiohalorhabdus sp. TaxID=3094134 RepID=UPI002FC3B6A4
MSLKERLNDDIKAAMRAKEKTRVGLLRMLQSAIRNAEIEQGRELSETEHYAVVNKLIKQRRDSVEQYRQGGRDDLADKEAAEAEILTEYLPPALSDAEIDDAVDQAITEAEASGPQDMGKVMGVLKERLQGRADMGEVSQRVKDRLAS